MKREALEQVIRAGFANLHPGDSLQFGQCVVRHGRHADGEWFVILTARGEHSTRFSCNSRPGSMLRTACRYLCADLETFGCLD
jgi:hypothetical protein